MEAYETLVDPGKRQQYDQQQQQKQQGGKQQHSNTHQKYTKFFERMANSFHEYIRKQADANWESADNGQDEHFHFNFNNMWDDADQEEVSGFKSAFQQHLEHHYAAHERAVREAARMAKLAASGQDLPGVTKRPKTVHLAPPPDHLELHELDPEKHDPHLSHVHLHRMAMEHAQRIHAQAL